VPYGSLRTRFAGATYDPTSHYCAAEVFDFLVHMQLSAAVLRDTSQHQVGLLCRELEALELPAQVLALPQAPVSQLGGFVALRAARAKELARALVQRGLHCDARGAILRLGPAPYLSDAQLGEAVAIVGEVARDRLGGVVARPGGSGERY
jgi:kynureninase